MFTRQPTYINLNKSRVFGFDVASVTMLRTFALFIAAAILAVLAEDSIKCVKDGEVKACYGNFATGMAEDGHNPLSADQTCRDYCTAEECKVLDGNLTQECGLCSTSAKCNPHAVDFEANKERTKGNNIICTQFCSLPCEELTGNPHFECGGCDDTKTCHPKADHFDDWFERRAQKKEL